MKTPTQKTSVKEPLKKAGNRSFDEILKIVRSIRKELEEKNLPAYTPREHGRIL